MKSGLHRTLAVVGLVAAIGFTSACSTAVPSGNTDNATSAARTPVEDLSIAIVLSGPITDNDFNQVGYEAAEAAGEEVGAEVAYAENVSDANAERTLRNFASDGYDLIIAHSFSFGDATLRVAAEFPDAVFMAGTATSNAENVGTYDNPDYQGAYLAGMLAAGVASEGTVGWVSAIQTPNLLANLHAYEAGAEDINPEITVLHSFIGSFYDPPRAREAALAQIQSGAQVLSAQTVGTIDGAIDGGALAIGALTDQNFLGPDNVLTSVLWDLAPVFTDVATAVQDGSWTNENYSYGVAEGSITLADFHGLDSRVPADVMATVLEREAEIASGEFEVPYDVTTVD
ncbi:nucleoside-binding protein [Glaciihabitans tibetensis]|uniref:Nucleoside-binding protein n=1 Tax=Glaciihabitans tibetensis TaxID=1266600 RepID=A0A2T0VF37_9MICO|nr:BMP family protein [Glaciihabitans tibetensis]PRY68818.1 nucleoside-binding protein [Glaciihabitans tibetensis]